jgi:hypothetical protein
MTENQCSAPATEQRIFPHLNERMRTKCTIATTNARSILSIFVFCICVFGQGSAQSLKINEFLTKNLSTIADNYLEFDDWIEIANVSELDIDLNGYSITDDLARTTRFQFSSAGNELVVPAHGYLILWADDQENQGKKHLNFNISSKGGVIALFSPANQLIDSVHYGQQYLEVSYGRLPGAPYAWKYFSSPTPGSDNNSAASEGVLDPPLPEIKPGFYNAAIQLKLNPSHSVDSILYSLNNLTPTLSSFHYTDPFELNKTCVVNAVDAKSGYINSLPYSGLYLFRSPFTLPVMAVLTDSFNLFGSSGIYTNYEESWERFCRINYFVNGNLEAEANAGLRIQGASSTFMPKKGFRFFFRGEYGTSEFKYPVFGSGNIESFKKLVVKPGYDDDMTIDIGTLLRDPLALELWKKTGGMKQQSSFIILYLNNRYWGIYNLRESVDENFIKAHTGLVDFDLVRLRNEGPDLEYGTLKNWSEMYDMAINSDLSVPENYQKLADVLDMDEFANLMAFVQCTHYYSWGWGISMYRSTQAPAKWHLSIWDADRAFNSPEWDGFKALETDNTGLYWANNITRNLMKSDEFKRIYSARLRTLLETVFRPDNSIAVLDSLYRIIKPEMQDELNRWAPENNKWEHNVQNIRDFLTNRPAVINNQMYDYLPVVTSTPEVSLITVVSAYPNPFQDRITIHISSKSTDPVNISIMGEDGRMIASIFSGKLAGDEKNIIWEGNDANGKMIRPGLYILHVSTTNQSYFIKIIRK